MGEAKQRRLAKDAGNPWPEDSPKVYPHAGMYLGDDGEWHPYGDRYHQRPRMNRMNPDLPLLAMIGAIR